MILSHEAKRVGDRMIAYKELIAMKFYDVMIKRLKVKGLINSIFELINEENKAGVDFSIGGETNPFLGFDKTNNELVGSNDGINFFPLYNRDSKPLVVEKESNDGFLYSSIDDGFPVGLIAPNNAIIPLLKETATIQGNNYVIELSAYMSYAGLDSLAGVWRIYVAAGSRGTKGDPGESLTLTVGSVTAGISPEIEITGNSPNQTLNFVLPSFGDSFEIVKASYDDTISVSCKGIPVMLKTNTGKYYNIRGREISLSNDKTRFIIDISGALAVNNCAFFEGEWVVYFAGSTSLSSKVQYHKILSDEDIALIDVAEGDIVSFFNSDGLLCTKNHDGLVSVISSQVTLGQVDINGNFQPLKFDGTTASADGSPESVDYYTWDNTTN